MTARRRKLKLAFLVLVCLLATCFFAAFLLRPRPKPQLYSGKTIREWVLLLDPDVNKQAQNAEAADKVSTLGTPVLPELERILKRRPDSTVEKLRLKAARWHLVTPEELVLPHLHFRATRAAYNLAEYGKVDISSLVPLISYDFTNTNYFTHGEEPRALAAAGPAGISVFTNLLATGTPVIRDQSAYGLHFALNRRAMQAHWPAIIEAEAQATSDPDRSVRVTAMLSFDNGRGPTNIVFPIALRFLDSKDGYERWAGADVLSGRTLNDELKAALQKALDDPEQRVQDAARRSLGLPATNAPVRQ